MQSPVQQALFDVVSDLPHGLVYQPDFLTVAEEAALLSEFRLLPFKEARFQQYTARRRVVRFGDGEYSTNYGSDSEEGNPSRPFPKFLIPLRRRIAQWRNLSESAFVHAVITEYAPGTPIGWHRDKPHFEAVVGVSLAGAARMRFRPYTAKTDRKLSIELKLEPRSAYVMQNDIRWHWQHHIPPTKELRYSVTLRTLCKTP